MTTRLLTVAAALLLGSALGCPDAPSADPVVAAPADPSADPGKAKDAAGGLTMAICDNIEAASECIQYGTASLQADQKDLAARCAKFEGTYKAGERCPTEHAVGKCDTGDKTLNYYYSTGKTSYTAESGKDECEMLGSVWLEI